MYELVCISQRALEEFSMDDSGDSDGEGVSSREQDDTSSCSSSDGRSVRDHFVLGQGIVTKKGKRGAKCKVCEKVISCPLRNTGNMT